MAKLSVKGALIGGVLDVVASGILGVPLVMYVIASRNLVGLPPEQLKRSLSATIHASPSLYATQLAIGIVCTILGGYVAGRLAKHDQILNGVASSGVCMLVGIYSIASGKSSESLLVQLVLLLIVTPLCGAAGGYLARGRLRGHLSTARPT